MTLTTATLVGAALIALTTAASVFLLLRQLRFARRAASIEAIKDAHELLAHQYRFPSGKDAFYALRERQRITPPERAGAGEERWRADMVERILLVHDQDRAARDADYSLAKAVIDSYNRVADLIDNGLLEPRGILATYHLAIIREVCLAEPHAWYLMIFEGQGRYGLRVIELARIARAYNIINPIHREDVYFSDADVAEPIYRVSSLRWYHKGGYWLRRHTIGYPSITERSKIRQKREIAAIRASVNERLAWRQAQDGAQEQTQPG